MRQNKDSLQEPTIDSALEKHYYELLFDNQEKHILHNPYTHELRQIAAIERGDLDDLKTILDEDFSSYEGIFCDNPLTQEIYMGIVNVTIACRAAIRGGVHYEKAFTLSDACIQMMSECKSRKKIRALYHAVQFQYARMVKESHSPLLTGDIAGYQQLAASPHVEHCKDYVHSHISQKITVQSIADNIGVNPNYLSSIFRKYEKISLKEYIAKEKILVLQKLLMYSPYSYVDIATRLGYSSQSHMGAEFKKYTGMTPRKFRETYQKDDFIELDIDDIY